MTQGTTKPDEDWFWPVVVSEEEPEEADDQEEEESSTGVRFQVCKSYCHCAVICIECGEASIGNQVFEINTFLLYMVWNCF